MSLTSSAIVLSQAWRACTESGALSSLTEKIMSANDDYAKFAAIFGNITLLGETDFDSFRDEDGHSYPLTRFLLEFNAITGDDTDIAECYATNPDEARELLGLADNYMLSVNRAFSGSDHTTRHEFASGYSADLASNISNRDLCLPFMIVARSAFHENIINKRQTDILDTVEFTWS